MTLSRVSNSLAWSFGECCTEGQVIGGVITPKNTVGDVQLLNEGSKFS